MSCIDSLTTLFNKLRTYEGTNMGCAFNETDKLRFQGLGGVVDPDHILTVEQFLESYVVLENGFPRIRSQYYKYFENMRIFVANFRAEGPVLESFFHVPYLKLIYNFKISEIEYKEEVVMEICEEQEVEEIFSSEDFLDMYQGDSPRYHTEKISDAYFNKVRKDFSMLEIIRKYRYYLRLRNIPMSTRQIDYYNPYEFVNT